MGNLLENYINKIASQKKCHFWLFLSGLIVLTCMMSYIYPITKWGHDYSFHMLRFNALIDALRNGQYPNYIDYTSVRNYGYLSKAFYCDLLLVPFAIVGLLTNTLFAYKTLLFAITLLSGIFMYWAVNRLFKNTYIASVSAILYTFSYYRLLDIYWRGALGESFAFTFIPIIMIGTYYIIYGDYKKWYIVTIGYSLLIFSHVISSVLVFITMIIIMIICYKAFVKEPKRLLYLCMSGIITILIVSYYLFPMIEQMLSNKFQYENSTGLLVNAQLKFFQIIWGMFYGFVSTDIQFTPGIGLLLTSVLFIRLFISRQKSDKLLKAVDIGVIIGLIYIFVSSSYFPWKIFPFNKLAFIQLPWRFYMLTSLFFAVAGGYYTSLLVQSKTKALICIASIMILTVLMMKNDSWNFINSTPEILKTENTIYTTNNIRTGYYLQGGEYLPDKLPSLQYIEDRGEVVKYENQDTRIFNLKKEKGITNFGVDVNRSDILELPLLYYKGYNATLNNKSLPIRQSMSGLIEIPVNQSGDIEVMYSGTFIQKTSPYVTLISVMALCIYIFIPTRKKFLKMKRNA